MRKFAAFLMLLCATTLAAQNVVYDEIHIFTGKLNGKIAFELAFVPEFDNEHKTIISRARDNDSMYEDTFKWKNGKLKRISSKKTPLFD